MRQLGLRAIVNLATAAGVVSVLLLVLRVDFPLMWGILAFFLSFIPWIGLPLAVAPAVVLALAEHGLTSALLVIAGVIVINVLAENALSPMLMGRGLSISPTVLFICSSSGAWLLGGPGAFLGGAAHDLPDLDAGHLPETQAGLRTSWAWAAPAPQGSRSRGAGDRAHRTPERKSLAKMARWERHAGAWRKRGIVEVGRRSILSFFFEHPMATYSAALAYRGVFGLFPFLLILVVLVGARASQTT